MYLNKFYINIFFIYIYIYECMYMWSIWCKINLRKLIGQSIKILYKCVYIKVILNKNHLCKCGGGIT